MTQKVLSQVTVQSDGVQGVVAVMQSNHGDVRDDAAGVLRNCSNYSYEAAEVPRVLGTRQSCLRKSLSSRRAGRRCVV
jgi:hypothetical protein